MAGQASIENGKKGGRPKGTPTAVTIAKQKAREIITQMVEAEIIPITAALIERAKDKDTAAAKELFDRAWGKAMQSIEMTGKDGKDLIPSLSPKVAALIDDYTHKRGKAATG